LDQELARLSAVLRQAVVLRYLQGNSEKQAAELAACPQGTLSRRASDGIAKLRQRLAKRGVALGGVALASLLTSEASAAVLETLIPSILATVKAAVATTATATGATSTAAILAKGAMKAMFIAKVKMVAAVVAAVVVTGTVVPVGIAVAQAVGKEAKPAAAEDGGRTAVAGDYLVIDLSGGPSASNYPVGYLSAVPSGGWTYEHKTTKLVLRKIPAGTFTMGSPTNELGRSGDETQHTVTVSRAFYLGVFEVTQRQWELVMGNKPSYFTNATCYATRPVERVSYYDIRESTNNRAMSPNWPATNAAHADSFMGKLRAKTGLTGFDLPTESQWECACRADTTTELNSGKNLDSGDSDANMTEVGRYKHNGGSNYTQNGDTSVGTAKVGSYLPNAYGLYDMHGNVSEWCLDCDLGSLGTPSGPYRLIRGGGWSMLAYGCRSAACYSVKPDSRGGSIGFRAAMTLP
jgi:formylglycine-generating enzyme required for sulfatase activity